MSIKLETKLIGMKYLSIIFLLTLLSLSAISCIDSEDKKLIIGQWTGTSWTVNDRPSNYNPAEATFTFHDDGTYSFDYGATKEAGKYFISNKELFTTPEGGLKMMVRVPRLTQDTMVFDMNRGGQAESLTLIRK